MLPHPPGPQRPPRPTCWVGSGVPRLCGLRLPSPVWESSIFHRLYLDSCRSNLGNIYGGPAPGSARRAPACLAIASSYSAPGSLPAWGSENLSLPLRPRPSPFSPRCCRRCHGNRRRLKLRGGLEGRARVSEGGAERGGRGESGERPGALGRSPGGEAVKPSGWSSLGPARMPGAGQGGQRPIHWRTGAWRRGSVGEAGGANGRVVDGGVVSWREVGGAWLTLSWEAGSNPREGAGPECGVT